MAEQRWHLWLHGRHLGEIQRLRTGRARLRFDDEVVNEHGQGTRLLSYSLPLTRRRIDAPALEIYLDNLLPEGSVRAQLEREYRVRPGDTLGLLSHIGEECAGAVQVTVQDELSNGELVPLADGEVTRLVAEMPTLTPPAGQHVTASLGGVQSKVLLTRTDQGWSWPAAGAISTHIIKPEPTDPGVAIPEIVELEEWALRLARGAEISAAKAEIVAFGDRRALVVERYDRAAGRRRHQEDFAQALGIRSGDKYEPADSHGRLRAIARGPGRESSAPREFRVDLLRLVTFNVLVGNGDGHAKNYALLLADGLFSLAPAYDIAPVHYVNPRFGDAGMRIAGQRQLRYIGAAHLVDEAVSWGMGDEEARRVVEETAEAVLAALDDIEPEVRGVALEPAVRSKAEAFLGS